MHADIIITRCVCVVRQKLNTVTYRYYCLHKLAFLRYFKEIESFASILKCLKISISTASFQNGADWFITKTLCTVIIRVVNQ